MKEVRFATAAHNYFYQCLVQSQVGGAIGGVVDGVVGEVRK